jgi:hypothetical protein
MNNLPITDPRGVLRASDWKTRNGVKVPRRECVNGPVISAKKFAALMETMLDIPDDHEEVTTP